MIKVYTGVHCNQCTATKRLLDKLGISFETIEAVGEVAHNLTAMGFKQLPVVITDSDKWSGFRPDKISKLIKSVDVII